METTIDISKSIGSKLEFVISYLEELNEPYSLDSKNRLQVTLETLKMLEELPHFPIQVLPEMASVIFPIYPSPTYFLRKWLDIKSQMSSQIITKSMASKNYNGLQNFIILKNNYFTKEAEEELKKLWGIRAIAYSIIFKVNEKSYKDFSTNNTMFHFPASNDGIFKFAINVKPEYQNMEVALLESIWQIKLLQYIFEDAFGKENFTTSFYYQYMYNKIIYFNEFLPSIDYEAFYEESNHKLDSEEITIGEQSRSLGIDFKWREEDLESIKKRISDRYDDISVHSFINHKYNLDLNL